MNLLHTSKTIPTRLYYTPQVCNKMVLVILEVCNQNRFGIVLEVGNTIVFVLF
jgi:hypothetical protein